MRRTRDYRRHQRRRVIANRRRLIRIAWGYDNQRLAEYRMDYGDDPPWPVQIDQPGRLETDHLCACSCWMCRWPQYDRDAFKRETRWLLSVA